MAGRARVVIFATKAEQGAGVHAQGGYLLRRFVDSAGASARRAISLTF